MKEFIVGGQVVTNRQALVLLRDFADSKLGSFCGLHGIDYNFVDTREFCTREGHSIDPLDAVETGSFYASTFSFSVNSIMFGLPISMCGQCDDRPVDVYEFVGMSICVGHEYQHLKQYFEDMHNGSGLGAVFCASQLSKQCNDDYYHMNYFSNPMEVDAQFRGVSDAYDMLTYMVGQDMASEYMTYYQNVRMSVLRGARADRVLDIGRRYGHEAAFLENERPIDFVVDRDYLSADDLLTEFETSFSMSMHSKRLYDFRGSFESGKFDGRVFHAISGLRRMFAAESDGLRQDMMLASLYCVDRMSPGLFGRVKRDTGLNLHPVAVFGEEFAYQILHLDKKRTDIEYDVKARVRDISDIEAAVGNLTEPDCDDWRDYDL